MITTLAFAQPKRVEELDLSVEGLEPSVTIMEHDNRMVEEYRSNNQLYMIKVTPKHGTPYYLVDPEGTGNMQWRRNSLGLDLQVPQWTLFSW